MSYDLYFKAAKKKLHRSAFEDFFAERRWYKLNETERGVQAWYENEDTGVYCSFDWSDEGVALNVNYFRPSFFGLETVREVSAFVDEFAPAISDPQSEGMGDGPYSRDSYLRGWNAGNRFGHRAILSSHGQGESFLTMPGARLQALWLWNYQRERAAEYLNEVEMLPCFIPKTMLVSTGGGLRTAVIWDGTIPILLPDVDTILMPAAAGLVTVDRHALDGVLAEWPIRPASYDVDDMKLGLPAREVAFEDAPAALGRTVEQVGVAFAGEGVAWDQVHDEELMTS